MKCSFMVIGLLTHPALAVSKSGRDGRELRYSSRGSEKELLRDAQVATMQVRRRAQIGKEGKGSKGISAGGGYEVLHGPFSNTLLDGDVLDTQGVNPAEGTPLDTGFPAEAIAALDQAEIDAMEEEGPDHDGPGKGKHYDHAADLNGGWDGSYPEAVNGEDTVAGETDDVETEDADTLDGVDTTEESPGILYGQSNTDTLSEGDGNDPNTRSAECKVTGPDIESLEVLDLAGVPITYFYTVSINDGNNLKGILKSVELKVLQSLVGIMACSAVRRLEMTAGNAQRRLKTSSTLRIESDPEDEPTDKTKHNCAGDACSQILIKGVLTGFSPEGANLSQIPCDFLPVINDAIANMDVTDINGLNTINPESTELPDQCLDNSETASVNAKNSTPASEIVPAGIVVGAAVGGMCLVLLGLLVVRQRMVKKRRKDNGSVYTKETRSPGEKSAMELTVDANETQTTGTYLTPRATDSVIGISASPDDCSEWGDGKGPSKIDDDDDDIDTPIHSSPTPHPSDITLGGEDTVSPTSITSPDPPISESPVVPFQANVQEEEHMTHDVDLVRDDSGNLREGLAEA